MKVSVSRLHFPVTTLGPGQRVGLWLQGCSLRCPGCISVDTWESGRGLVPVEAVRARFSQLAPSSAGLTVSGGEPLDQPEALTALLQHWRSVSKASVLLFTGREWEDAEGWLSANAGLVDCVIAGRFRSDLPQTLALRGSDNQELRILSDLGEEFRAYERVLTRGDRRLDVMFDEEGDAWLAGIPARGELGRLRRLLAAQGHKSHTSDMRGEIAA